MKRQMCRLQDRQYPRKIIFHSREYSYQPWKPYFSSSHVISDYPIPGDSKNWTAFQHLRQAGW